AGVSDDLFKAFPGLGEHLSYGEERRALAVRDAAADEDGGFVADASDELAHEPCLADSRLADDGEQARAARLARPFVCATKRRQLPFAPDQLRVGRPGDRPR